MPEVVARSKLCYYAHIGQNSHRVTQPICISMSTCRLYMGFVRSFGREGWQEAQKVACLAVGRCLKLVTSVCFRIPNLLAGF